MLWSDHLFSLTRGPNWPVRSLDDPKWTHLNNQTLQNILWLRRMGWNFAIQLLAIPFVIHDDTKEYARKPRITVNSNCSNCSSKFTATSISTLSPILEHTGTAANLYTMTRRSVHSVFSFCSWTTTNLYTVSVQCCLWKSKLEVSSAFRLLAGRWKTASIVGKNVKIAQTESSPEKK